MKNYEEHLKRAVMQAPAPDLEKLKKEPVVKMKEHDDITRQENRGRIVRLKPVLSVCAACACLCFVLIGWMIRNNQTDSYIELDINPSMEIAVNRKDQVLKLEALNEDAKKVIGRIDWKKKDVDDVMKDILNEMLDEGYFKEAENMILLSVDNKNSKKAEKLMNHLEEKIQSYLNSRDIYPTIIRQMINGNKEQRDLAKAYHMSMGKLYLINEILELSDELTFEELSKRSIKDLTELYTELKEDEKTEANNPDKKPDTSKTDKKPAESQKQPSEGRTKRPVPKKNTNNDRDDADDEDDDKEDDDGPDDNDKKDSGKKKQPAGKPASKPAVKPSGADKDEEDSEDDDDDEEEDDDDEKDEEED